MPSGILLRNYRTPTEMKEEIIRKFLRLGLAQNSDSLSWSSNIKSNKLSHVFRFNITETNSSVFGVLHGKILEQSLLLENKQ